VPTARGMGDQPADRRSVAMRAHGLRHVAPPQSDDWADSSNIVMGKQSAPVSQHHKVSARSALGVITIVCLASIRFRWSPLE
jgi:hypothetical protein